MQWEGEEMNRKQNMFYVDKFISCVDIGMKTRGYGRIVYKFHV